MASKAGLRAMESGTKESCGGCPPGLFPIFIDPHSGRYTNSHVSFGAMGDSFYEYLIKVYVQGRGEAVNERWRALWEVGMDSMNAQLLQKSTPAGMTYVAEWSGGSLIHKMDHLACFVPGMLALGAPHVRGGDVNGLPKAKYYMQVADELMYTCWQMYARMASGLSAEMVNFRAGADLASGAHHNLLRPEAVESLMLMWRRTGDQKYRDWGWTIFESFERHCKVEGGGYAGLTDVNVNPPNKDDTMQSFWLAETLKYFYLLFSSTDVIPLDQWVFNTEAHPLKIFPKGWSDELASPPPPPPSPPPSAAIGNPQETKGLAAKSLVAEAAKAQADVSAATKVAAEVAKSKGAAEAKSKEAAAVSI